ncbi:MAG: DNA recombination protein RmuC, partial [Epsilonproteobacteria bacterium]|nr:DNA recombination protein RmuC [Campylobacterota bacterium]
ELAYSDTKAHNLRLDTLVKEKDKNLNQLKETLEGEKETNAKLQNELREKESQIATLDTAIKEQQKSMKEKFEILQESKEKLTQEFHSIATEILDKNSKKFTEQNKQGVQEILTPLNRQIEEFKKRVDDIYDKESRDRSMLLAEIKVLKELNKRIGQDAINLTNALKGQTKKQGVWGEMILERVLESSGLRKGIEYEREVVLKSDDEDTFRPDVIVKLPNNRQIIIDAKTSLLAYERYASSDNDEEKERYLREHLRSLYEHIRQLSSKDYERLRGINSLDFIFMFIPIEGALMVALEKDTELYDKAFKEHIVLVSPTTLLVALRAVENSWRYEKQAQNIKEVTRRAEALYGKFVGFLKDFEAVGKSIKKSRESYEEALKKLSKGKGNIIRQVTLFKEISNISPKQEIPQELKEASLLEE